MFELPYLWVVLSLTRPSQLQCSLFQSTYSFPNALTVYILDIYVLPEHRKGHIASKLADDICDLAKTKGCNRLLGSVMLNANKVNDSIAVLEAYGMKVCSITDETVFFEKELN